MPRAYYNENDPQIAAWLRELIKQKVLTDGEVDERDIRDVLPADLAGFDRCHFFAGIGVWDYALTQAGHVDAGSIIWTGSCPCQPFSSAGKRAGFDDERHLWPFWFWLISQCRPDIIYGEQVGGSSGRSWFSLVSSDLGGVGYTGTVSELPACGFGAPHRRQRLWFVAESDSERCERERLLLLKPSSDPQAWRDRQACSLGEPNERRFDGQQDSAVSSKPITSVEAETNGSDGVTLGDATGSRHDDAREYRSGSSLQSARSEQSSALGVAQGNTNGSGSQRRKLRSDESADQLVAGAAGFVNGFWADAEWIHCTDEKYRAVEPGTFPLADGAPFRVVKLRGYGNAIVSEAAIAFIKSHKEAKRE